MPEYLPNLERDVLTFVLVTEPNLSYGFSTKNYASLPGGSETSHEIQQIGHGDAPGLPNAAIRIYAANSPKPPTINLVINFNPGVNQQGTISTFCALNQIRTAEGLGWRQVEPVHPISITNTPRTVTVGVQLSGEGLYLTPMNRADAETYGIQLGLLLPEGINSDLAPDVKNPILSKMATKLIGFQPLKIGFSELFGQNFLTDSLTTRESRFLTCFATL